jgi:hypothetical protein
MHCYANLSCPCVPTYIFGSILKHQFTLRQSFPTKSQFIQQHECAMQLSGYFSLIDRSLFTCLVDYWDISFFVRF